MTTHTTTRYGSAVVTLPSDTEIRIERAFDAPAALVFEAWTTPEHVRRWWGPDGEPLTVCDIDLRVGGAWRYAMEHQGVELGWHGTYQEVSAPDRLVATEVFEGFPDAEAINTLTLTEADGVTTLVVVVRHASQANRDGHVESGMEAGMQQTLDHLEDLVTGRS